MRRTCLLIGLVLHENVIKCQMVDAYFSQYYYSTTDDVFRVNFVSSTYTDIIFIEINRS